MAISQQKLLSPKEVSERLNIHVYSVKSLARSGKLKSIKIGHRTIRFMSEDIDNFLLSFSPNGGGSVCNQ